MNCCAVRLFRFDRGLRVLELTGDFKFGWGRDRQRQMRNAGALRSATHDEAVSRFGQDDVNLGGAKENRNGNNRQDAGALQGIIFRVGGRRSAMKVV
jgi:hypothetical protein